MATQEDYDFSTGDAGASMSYASEAGQIRVGGYIVMKGDKPCKVSAVSTSKTGKHGHAKCNFTAIDIFTGKKHEDIIPSTHTAQVPNVVRCEYDLVDITDDGFVCLMDESGNSKDDIKLPIWPESYGRELQKLFQDSQTGEDGKEGNGKNYAVVVMSAMGTDQIVSHKEATDTA
jgi:translation initiation factor 5A